MSESSASSGPDLLNDLAHEFAERYRRGERPSLTEYVARYPHLAAQIRDLFPALVLMENLGSAAGPPTGPYGPAATGGEAPCRLGDYRILREVARGGMGVVYEAVQESLGRHVALKVLPGPGLLGAPQLERFRREARAAAMLHHSNIVPVFGVGEDHGVHYYAMQFIQGQGLDSVLHEVRRLRQQGINRGTDLKTVLPPQGLLTEAFPGPTVGGLDPVPGPSHTAANDPVGSSSTIVTQPQAQYFRSVARMGAQVAEALAYAHQQGVLHRDVKPSNLLVDVQGTVWVTDFGLAKAEGAENLTRTGDVVGTLRYMAPERFEGRSDARSDVYSLGLTLYEMLTLKPAFDGSDRPQLIEQVLHGAPARPRQIDPHVPRDLETIVLKAIDRDPARRYPTAVALAEDLRRFLEDRPIRARRVGARERLWRWCRRNPALATATATAALLLVGVAGVSTVAAIRIAAERTEAENARQDEEGQRLLAQANAEESRQRLVRGQVAGGAALVDQGDLLGALPWFAEALRLDQGDPLHAEGHRLRLATAVQQSPRLVALWKAEGGDGQAVFCADGKRVLIANTPPPQLRLVIPARSQGVLWTADVATGRRLVRMELAGTLLDFALSPDGKRVATACEDGTAQVWDLETGRPLGGPLRHKGPVRSVAFRPDGRQVVTAGDDRTARIWDAGTGQAIQVLDHAGSGRLQPLAAVFSPDGERVATSQDGKVRLWRVADGKPLGGAMQVESGSFQHDFVLAFSADGRRLLVGGGERVIRTWDLETGRLLRQAGTSASTTSGVRFSPDRKRAVFFGAGNPAQVWDVDAAEPVTPPRGRLRQAYAADFDPQGDTVATGGMDGAVHVWQARTGDLVAAPLRNGTLTTSVEFSPDGRQVVTRDVDGIVRVWDLAGAAGLAAGPVTPGFTNPSPRGGILSPQADRLAFTTSSDSTHLWDPQTGRLVAILRHDMALMKAFSPDGRRLVTGSVWGTARVWDARTGRPVGDWVRHGSWVAHAAFSPDGRLLVTAGKNRIAIIWEAETARQVAEFRHDRAVRSAAFSPDGRRVVTGTGDFADYADLVFPLSDPKRVGEARVWDVATGRPLTPPLRHAGAVQQVLFSPDGRLILTVTAGGPASRDTVQVWDAAGGVPVGEPLVHAQGVFDVVFSPDGRRVATSGLDGGVRLWDVATGRKVLAPVGHTAAIFQLAFSPDGRRLLTGSHDSTARLWDADTGQPIAVFGHAGPVIQVAFAGDGHSIVTGCADGAVRTWRLEPDPRPADDWTALARVLSGGRADPGSAAPVSLSAIEQTWQELRAKYPQDFGTSRQEQTRWHRAAAEEALRKKAGPAALTHLGRLVEINPAGWPDRLTRARLLARLERWDEAEAEHTRAVEGHADVAAVWLARGSFRLGRGRRDEAAADFRKALDLQPAHLPAALSEFWVAGLYGEDLSAAYPPEAQTDPAQPIPPIPEAKEAGPHWRAEVTDPTGYLDLAACFDQAEHISAYALAYAYSPAEQDVVLFTGSDDSMRLWLNGDFLYEHRVGRQPRPDDDCIPARLRAGWNVVLVKVVNYTGRHGLFLRLSVEPADLVTAFLRKDGPEQALAALDARLAAERGKPGEAAVRFERGLLRARLGRWKEAAEDFAAGLALDPGDHYNWYRGGFLCLQVGDRDGYRRHCREMLRRFGDTQDPMIAERTAKLCSVLPGAGGDPDLPLRLAERAVDRTERHGTYPWFLAVKGFAECRAGRYQQSLDWLHKSEERLDHPIFKAQTVLYGALALHHLRRGEEARRDLDRARKMLDGQPGARGPPGELWWDWIMCQVLRREAEGLIEGKAGGPR
jgi:WD40 repeat protein/serine/threonine protein kinase/tetratricopeptide (TPR) repeat protein